jgi:hypothetical protein
MSALPACSHPRDIAKEHSLFEIDETLDLLVQAATDQYDETGQIAADLQAEMAAYAEAMGEKIDRIAAYLKVQKATAEIAAQEIARLEARKRAAENREKRLKEMLAAFMKLKDVTKLRGRLNTISSPEEQHAEPRGDGSRRNPGCLLPGDRGDVVAGMARGPGLPTARRTPVPPGGPSQHQRRQGP